jgi:hypothetical protein
MLAAHLKPAHRLWKHFLDLSCRINFLVVFPPGSMTRTQNPLRPLPPSQGMVGVDLTVQPLSIKHLADRLNEKHGLDYDRAITPKWIGTIVRQKLHLKTYKRHGAFVVSVNEKTLEPLYEKYGVRDDADARFLSRGAPNDSLPLPIGGLGDLGTLGEGRWPRDSIETKAP